MKWWPWRTCFWAGLIKSIANPVHIKRVMSYASGGGSRENIGYTFKLFRQPKVVSIQMAEDCPCRGLKSSIERCRLPSIFLADVLDRPETSDNALRFVRRAIINQDDFFRRPGLRENTFQASRKESGVVIGTYDDGRLISHRAA
jgi:hypothetical protein